MTTTADPTGPTNRLPRPDVAPPGPWSFPAAETAELDNGLRVLVHRLSGQHVIAANLILPVPPDAEPREHEGVLAICARTLDEGSRLHDGETFAELMESEGAGLGVEIGPGGLQLVLDVPSTRFSPALGLLAEAATVPAFAAADVDRHVQLRLAEIEQAWANPGQASALAFRRAVYADGTRPTRMTEGEPETVRTVDRDLVAGFHARHVGPRGATLVLAGDFAEDPFALAERHFGGWAVPDQQVVDPVPARPGDRTALIVDRPGAVQADVRLGGFGIDRNDPRWAAAVIGAYAMGGAFLSRLNRVLREERGYSYGVRLGLSPLRRGGTFAVQGSFRTEVTAEALVEARALLRVDDDPFTATEVEEAIAFFAGVSPLRYATADGVVDQAASQVLAGLPTDYVDHNLRRLREVTPEAATEAYRSLVDPDALTLVLAGDAERLTGPLTEAGWPVQRFTR
ncbi:putative Zn-dependent peptidase [Friedmanniella endophytica]|uniref:Putative Zn-dependent peptidase n=1 Tax=Microlunatus kandeliicorticis TaxID=1759536 RepID=A0A7W3IUQ0_9ACTN|nr:pitrilysin family protein [Microlunatus kandeliicorticis]MBA8795611.1 putative Zn-dependent peptidase [Microlunatus kandeliicorticis]